MNNQVGDTGSGEPLIIICSFEEYFNGIVYNKIQSVF